jgi:phosphatidate cytidylyltransferase
MAGDDEREQSTEDIFEDLDKFFAPIDEVEWPEEAPHAEGAGAASGNEGEPEAEAEPQVEAEPEVLPPSAGEAAEVFMRPGTEAEPEAELAAGPPPGEPTAEMSGEDWRRLRDVLGDEDDESFAFEQPAESQAAGGETAFEYEDIHETAPAPEDVATPASGEEPSGLSLEDLKKAPPQYSALPGPDDEEPEPVSAEEAAAVFIEGDAMGLQDDTGLGEPAIVDVEAVAERLAEGLRNEDEAAAKAPSPSEPEEDLEDFGSPGPRTVRVGADTLGGPTWEEPSSGAMDEEGPAGGGGRNVSAAIITGAVLVGAGLLSIWYSKAAFAVVGGIVVLIAQAELYATMQRRGYQPATALGLVVGGLLMAGAYLRGEAGAVMFVAFGLVLTFLWYMAAPQKARDDVLKNVAATMLGVVYLPLLAGYVLIMLSLNGGKGLVLAVIGLTALYDVSAFAVGSFIGRWQLAPTISPKKSWEGLFGATAVTFFVGVVVLSSIDPFSGSVARAAAMALVIVVFAPLGDLAESLLKRDLRVKDMGTILPGHGGVLDRIDSILFVAPAAFYLLRLIL